MNIDRPKRVPIATYRLQLHRGFTFARASACADYLDRLGISDLYLSPVLASREGSTHGYDVVDPSRVRADLGGEAQLGKLRDELRRRRMGLLLDIVPNHMCVASEENQWWNDVLRRGRSSRFARFFDIDWASESDSDGKVVVPFLSTSLEAALASSEISLVRGDGSFAFQYGDLRFPTRIETWLSVLETSARRLERLKRGDAGELRHLVDDAQRLVHRVADGRIPNDDATRLHERVSRLIRVSPDVREAVDASVGELNRRPDAIREMLSRQFYELADWREAGRRGSYRRFFDVNELAAVRVEDDDVFRATHEKILELVAQDIVTGLRVDHVDGLTDPSSYLERLPDDCFVVVEKILDADESLPEAWPVEGTTGYEFLNALNGVLVDTASEPTFRERYHRFVESSEPFDDVVYACKKLVLRSTFASDVARLARALGAGGSTPLARDSHRNLVDALTELAACFPVYRSYVGPQDETPRPEDRRTIGTARSRAKARAPAELAPTLDALADLLELEEGTTPEDRDVVLRFQQLTGAVMAKGFEDTALYRFHPLASLNEVGGDPTRFGMSVASFHRINRERQKRWPNTLSATSTHDTKRSEDVRARINVLSELGETWWDTVSKWRRINARHRPDALDPRDEYLLYQTLVGAWPPRLPDETAYDDFVARIQAYMKKAVREAKVSSSWVSPDEEYEQALSSFIARITETSRNAAFLEALTSFLASILDAGFLTSISQVLLKIGSPGIPDFYQGSEMWDYSLVDPDNRRAVDFERRANALAEVDTMTAAGSGSFPDELVADLSDGRLKLFVTSRGLRHRRSRATLFSSADYVPIACTGPKHDHVVAFARVRGDEAVVFAAGKHFTRLPMPPTSDTWMDTALQLGPVPGAAFRDVLTGRRVRPRGEAVFLKEVFASMPFAILEYAS